MRSSERITYPDVLTMFQSIMTRRRADEAEEQGFTLIEMCLAAALALIVMAVALIGVVEAQRSINTSLARDADANAAQSTIDAIEVAIQSGGVGSVVAVDSTGSQLWVYAPNGVRTGNAMDSMSSCVVWEYTNGTLVMATGGAGTALTSAGAQVQGVRQSNGSDVFQAVSAYSGLVDIDLTVQGSTEGSATNFQSASQASRLETQVQDPAMLSAVETAGTDIPDATCYPA
jgi:prepilin-type N-terminal cleavage/methylation domain-containing protein